MSKNLTRKGLALGAVVALGSSLFAGSPALAADPSINFTSVAGTSNKTILGGTFELSGTFANYGTVPSLKVLVTGAAEADLTVGTAVAATSVAADVATARGTAQSGNINGDTIVTPSSVVYAFDGTEELGRKHIVSVKLGTGITSTTTVNVQLFVDSVDINNKIDSGEVASPIVPVTFVKRSEVVPTVKIDSPVIGATSVFTHITLGDINLQQIDTAQVKSSLSQNGGVAVDVSSAWVEDDAALTAEHTGLTIAKDNQFNATAKIKNQDGTWTSTGSASGLVSATDSAYDVNTVAAVKAVSAGNVSGQSLRAGIKTFDFKSKVTINNTNTVEVTAPAGLAAKVTFANVDLGASVTLTSGSKKIDIANSVTSITVDAVTNADGYVVVPAVLSAAVDTQSFSVTIKVADKTGGTLGYATSGAGTFNFVAAVDAIAFAGNAGHNAEISVVKGGTVSIPFTIYDNFQKAYDAKKYRVTTTSSNPSSGNGASISDIEYIENGTGSVSFTDNSSATGTYDVDFAVAEYNSDSSDWTGTVTASAATTVKVNVVSSNAAARVTATTGDNGGVLALADFEAVNANSGADAYTGDYEAALGYSSGTDAEEVVSGNVYAADGSALAGVPVTITGAGLLFGDAGTIGDTKVTAIGSITVYTAASGAYSVIYYSQKSGTTEITVKSGSATKTLKSDDFAAWASVDNIAKATITGPSNVATGRSAQYRVALVDAHGNVVKVENLATVSYDGAGYFTQDLGAITKTTVGGTLALTLVTGSTDSGSGTLSVTLSGFGNAALSGNTGADKDDNIVLSQSITIGATPVANATAAVSGSTGKFYVSATAAAGKSVVVKVAGKFVTSFKATGSKKSVAVKATKGSKKVTVFVGGKLVATKTVTVK